LGAACAKADAYDPANHEFVAIDYQADIFLNVWKEGAELRKSGRLLRLAEFIECPVVAIHGDYDPHPAEGVRAPLRPVLKDFRFILLSSCGHRPWNERQARGEFFRVLEEEL
ncbi:alpha/beta hydrolase, partial [Thermodesulfobacteriota bacterium]